MATHTVHIHRERSSVYSNELKTHRSEEIEIINF